MLKLTSRGYLTKEDAEHDRWLQRQFWGDLIQLCLIKPKGRFFHIETFIAESERT